MQTELFPSADAHVAMCLPDRGDGIARADCRCGQWTGQAHDIDDLADDHRRHAAAVAPLEFASP